MASVRNPLLRAWIAGAALCAVLVLVCAASAPAQEQAPSPAEPSGLTANMDNVLLEDFIKFVGRYTGRNIIYRSDQIPKTSFNIFSQQSISEPELMAIFHQLLETVGLQAMAKGDAYYIFPTGTARNVKPSIRPGSSALSGAKEELVVTVYQVNKDVPTTAVAGLLNGLKSPVGQVQEIPQARALLITDTRDQLQRMLRIMNMVLELNPGWQVEIFPLTTADSTSVVAMLTETFTELVKRGKSAEVPLLKPIVWTNSILFAGTDAQRADVQDLISKVDHIDQAAASLKVYRLRNAKATSVATVLQSLVEVITGQGENAKKTSTSDAFKVSADEDTNSLLVIGSKDILPQIEEIIAEIDLPQDQVFIEALIMETSLENSREFGVEWMAGGGTHGEVGTIGFMDDTSGTLQSYADPVYGSTISTMPSLGSLPGGFSLGILGNIITYGGKRYPTVGALVNYAKSAGGINILSTPQIMTLDNTEAEIFVGENRPYQTGTSYDSNNNPVYSYDYRNVGVTLNVKPTINRESGLVRLEIDQSLDQVQAGSLATAPTTLKRSTKATVQIMDGSTMVISGMVDNTLDKNQTGIPGLANLPLLGWLFKNEASSADKTTLMIFVTAKIINTVDAAEGLTNDKMRDVQHIKEEGKEYFEKMFEWEFGKGQSKKSTKPASGKLDVSELDGLLSPPANSQAYGEVAGKAEDVSSND